jgi:hypothetical protein
MTDEKLKFLAKQCAAMAKTELRTKGEINCILVSYHQDCGLHRMRKVEKLIVELAGEGWLNSPARKERAFGILCAANALSPVPPEAMVIVTVADQWVGNEAFAALPPEEQQRIYEENPRNRLYFAPRDVVIATAQTPERLCMYWQRLQGTLLIGEPHADFFNQAEFSGNLKVYGDPPPELLEALRKHSGV